VPPRSSPQLRPVPEMAAARDDGSLAGSAKRRIASGVVAEIWRSALLLYCSRVVSVQVACEVGERGVGRDKRERSLLVFLELLI